MNYNKVTLLGRVGVQPEIKYFDSGSKIAQFSLATSEKYKDKEDTQWHNIKIVGRSVDFVEKYLNKGALVLVEGSIKYRSYEKDGEKKYFTEIVCFNIQSVQSASAPERTPMDDVPKTQDAFEPATSDDDDDLPF